MYPGSNDLVAFLPDGRLHMPGGVQRPAGHNTEAAVAASRQVPFYLRHIHTYPACLSALGPSQLEPISSTTASLFASAGAWRSLGIP
jgi:hypothetical protein